MSAPFPPKSNAAWRREAPRDNDSEDGRSEIDLEDTTEEQMPALAWQRKAGKTWSTRTKIITAVIASILIIGFMVAALHHKRAAVRADPNLTILKPHFFPEHKSERVMIRYGPFTAPAMSEDNGMKNFMIKAAQKPCTDCLVTWMQAGLTYEDGSEANADTGMWLHHTVLSNTNRSSLVCPDNFAGDRFFASGNERTPIDICVGGTDKAGYYIAPTENIGLALELMNMAPTPRAAYLTMTFEYIPSRPAAFSPVQPLWFDIGGCGSSELPAKPDAHFDYTSPGWTATPSGSGSGSGSVSGGRVTFIAGHLHDGGTRLEVVRNGEVACVAVAEYKSSSGGREEEGKGKRHEHEHAGKHISSMSTCENVGRVEEGDEWSITAHYDTAVHAPMVNADGSLEPIMGIAMAYVAGASGQSADLGKRWIA